LREFKHNVRALKPAGRRMKRSRGPVEHETSTRTSLVTSLPLAMAQMLGILGGMDQDLSASIFCFAIVTRCSPPSKRSKTSTRSRGRMSAKIAR
jgi:hypothetical protein